MDLKAGLFARLLLSVSWSARLSADGLMLDGTLIRWEAITGARKIRGWLFNDVELEADGRTVRLVGFPRQHDALLALFRAAPYPRLIETMLRSLGAEQRFLPRRLRERFRAGLVGRVVDAGQLSRAAKEARSNPHVPPLLTEGLLAANTIAIGPQDALLKANESFLRAEAEHWSWLDRACGRNGLLSQDGLAEILASAEEICRHQNLPISRN